ncbi:MAG: hypothetical protein WC781_01795 [Candidatus Pacearchaeota archaeon]|jgi:hypothetical protein
MDAKELIQELNKEELMKQGNISLILDGYNDLFSDFDPRSYSERALSDDFLVECKRAARDRSDIREGFELRLLAPKAKRNLNDEIKIKKRLKSHFHKHYIEKLRDIRKLRIEGWIWFALGVLFMLFATFIHTYIDVNFFFSLLFIISEPAGWFSFWEGLDKVFITSREKKPDVEFYKKMVSAEISFISY